MLSIVVLLLGTGLVVYLRRRKNNAKQLPTMPGLLPGVLPVVAPADKRLTMSLKQLKISTRGGGVAPLRDGFYGPVASAESDSDTSSFYHEPYQQHMNKMQRGLKGFSDPEYGCLIQKEPLVLTPKGLHSSGIYHNDVVQASIYKMTSNVAPPTIPLPRPPMSESPSSFTSGKPTTENYYATTDIIHVS